MRKLLALAVLALVFSVLLPTPARASGWYPTPYGCALGSAGWHQGVVSATYTNDGSAFGIAFAVSELNIHFQRSSGCSTNSVDERPAYSLVVRATVDRNVVGAWGFCDDWLASNNNGSRLLAQWGHPVIWGSPCGTPNWPVGYTRIRLRGSYTSLDGIARFFDFTFYS